MIALSFDWQWLVWVHQGKWGKNWNSLQIWFSFILEGDKGEGEKEEGEGSGGKSRQKVKKKRSFKKSFQGIMNRKSKSDKDDDDKK